MSIEWEKDKTIHVKVAVPILAWIDKQIVSGRWKSRGEAVRAALWGMVQACGGMSNE
jgi:Arc/MetJ-type ribon-helix-helix transcriptional regulator